jgi:alpha-ketoglutarate-dependent taurine dioxygenase
MKTSFFNSHRLPLVVEPNGSGNTKADLEKYITDNKQELEEAFYKNGAVLFRGFAINTPKDFEDIALRVDNRMESGYYGTSPRNPVAGTKFVYTASELPGYYPIPQHCEMSYVKHPPVTLFFYCHVEPPYGGETPLCNFRKVYAGLNPEIREAFDRKGVLTVRNYSGLGKSSKLNLFELKRWNEIFLTTDKSEVERQCREQNMDFEWLPNDGLRITHHTPAAIEHPRTKEKVWFNHLQVFHPTAAAEEYKHIHQHQHRIKTFLWSTLISLMVKVKKATTAPIDQSMNVLFGDGTEIPDSYVQHVEEVIWKNLVIFPWKKNDVIAIDNFSTAHGRLPFEGPREILVAWSV